jgi:hypothetical protein
MSRSVSSRDVDGRIEDVAVEHAGDEDVDEEDDDGRPSCPPDQLIGGFPRFSSVDAWLLSSRLVPERVGWGGTKRDRP